MVVSVGVRLGRLGVSVVVGTGVSVGVRVGGCGVRVGEGGFTMAVIVKYNATIVPERDCWVAGD
jgi:hypothetical protein